jgi:hypothetical protein
MDQDKRKELSYREGPREKEITQLQGRIKKKGKNFSYKEGSRD